MNTMTTLPTMPRLAAIAVAVFFSFSTGGHALAQNPPAKAAADDGCSWFDSKTGKLVPTVPKGGGKLEDDIPGNEFTKQHWVPDVEVDLLDGKHAFNRKTGQNYFLDKDGCWTDSKTGKLVPTVPKSGGKLEDDIPGNEFTKQHWVPDVEVDLLDGKHAFNRKTGQNYFRGPCPPPDKPQATDGGKTGSVPARLELGLGYCYMHPADEAVKSLHGFTVSGLYPVNSWLAAGGEFSGLYGTETQQFAGGELKTSLRRYLYLLGPQVTLLPSGPVRIFGRVLAGGVHDGNQVSFRGGSTRFSANAFALAVGASAEIQIAPRFSAGASLDYAPTHFTSPTGNNWQQNWRAGVAGKVSF